MQKNLQKYAQASLKSVRLEDFRKQIKKRQADSHARRGSWIAWSGAQLSDFFTKQLTPNSRGHWILGSFSPRLDWDEARELPQLDERFRVAFPRIKNGSLSFHLCTSSQLRFNRDFGIWEAPSHALECTPDVLYVPCLSADRSGRRLGRGGGFYDAFLTKHPQIPHVAFLHSDYFFEELPQIFFHSKDQHVRAILTENFFNIINHANMRDDSKQNLKEPL